VVIKSPNAVINMIIANHGQSRRYTLKVLNQAVKGHKDRFPEGFMFQLTMEEARIWWTEVRGSGERIRVFRCEMS